MLKVIGIQINRIASLNVVDAYPTNLLRVLARCLYACQSHLFIYQYLLRYRVRQISLPY